ncbi:hypothetical protein V3Q77_02990 [Flavobacterium davisii]|uniref:Uncharacterized protein n=2 Tax=Flavobacterium TaxID=237 RepID=A0ABW8PN16_9FLAO
MIVESTKFYAMIKVTIKTHDAKTNYQKAHFFVLNKGNNAGKTILQPCMNCFTVEVDNPDYIESVKYLCNALAKSNFWKIYLRGSVIPFLALSDFKKHFTHKINEMDADYENHLNLINQIKTIEQAELHFTLKSQKINQLKLAVINLLIQ